MTTATNVFWLFDAFVEVQSASVAVWPDDGIKSWPIFTDIDQKVAKYFLHDSCII